jgi:hypothetical protein
VFLKITLEIPHEQAKLRIKKRFNILGESYEHRS